MADAAPLWRRFAGFTLLPAIAAVSPLLVLPVVARIAGPSGWASAIAGESIGTFAAIAIGYGWGTIGPALVSVARDGTERARLYRDSLVVRLLVSVIALPMLVIVCWLVAEPGVAWLSVLMGVQGALVAMSFTWFAVGVGDPRSIVLYDAVPRLLAAVVSAVLIVNTGFVEVYPITGIAVTVIGTAAYSWRLLRRHPGPWPSLREVPGLLRRGAPIALNDAALGAYSSVPAPLVTLTAPATAAAGFASADKMLKLGSFLPLTLANALQAWIAEAHGHARARRMRRAVGAHVVFGLLGWVVLGGLGHWASLLLFGAEAAAPVDVLIVLGLAFAFFSTRTSLTRHVLLPAGESHAVMRATLLGTVLGVPTMIILGITVGPLGVAIGFAATEAVATGLLVKRSAAAVRLLERQEPITP